MTKHLRGLPTAKRSKVAKSSKPGPKVEEKEREKRVVRTSYGVARCLYCKKTFERGRPWSRYDTPGCRMMHWHTLNRRKTKPGYIVEIDGELLDQPLPVIDAKLERQSDREVAELMSPKRQSR